MQGYDPVNKSYTREQHRLAHFFGDVQQRFWKLSEWPGWVQDIALTTAKDYGQRTRMFYFLVRNNLYSPMARDWVLACDYIDNKLIPHPYEEAVKMDMASLVKKALAGQVAAGPDVPSMSMVEGRVIRGLNPAHYPSYEQLRATEARAVQHAAPGPERTGRKPRSQVYYPPSTLRPKVGVTSGFRFVPGIGLMYLDLDKEWKVVKK